METKENITNRLLGIINKLVNNTVVTNATDHYYSWLDKSMWNLGLDELGTIEVISLLEKEFSVVATDEDFKTRYRLIEDITPREIVDIFLGKCHERNNDIDKRFFVIGNVGDLLKVLAHIPDSYKIKIKSEFFVSNPEVTVCLIPDVKKEYICLDVKVS